MTSDSAFISPVMCFSQHPIHSQCRLNLRDRANPGIVDTIREKGLIKYHCL